jgi:nitrogenase subunit NifH
MKKTSLVAGAVAAAVTVGSFGVASAATTSHSAKSVATTATRPSIGGMANANGVNPLKSVLDALVTKGTITAAQESAIIAAFDAAKPALPNGGPAGGMGRGGRVPEGATNSAAEDAAILSTLGIDAATLKADRVAGKSLATIAGPKTQALIDALVALENKEIDAALAAGQLTAAQATTQKTNTVARVTAHVNATPGKPGMGMGGMGWGGHGHGPAGAPGTGTTAPSTNG